MFLGHGCSLLMLSTLQADIARLRAGASDNTALQQPLARRPQSPPSSMADASSAPSNGPGTSAVPTQQQPQRPPPPQRPSLSHDDLPVGGSAGKRAEMPPEFPPEGPPEDSASVHGAAGSPGRRPTAAAKRGQQRPGSQQGLADSPGRQPHARTPPAMERPAGTVHSDLQCLMQRMYAQSVCCCRPSSHTLVLCDQAIMFSCRQQGKSMRMRAGQILRFCAFQATATTSRQRRHTTTAPPRPAAHTPCLRRPTWLVQCLLRRLTQLCRQLARRGPRAAPSRRPHQQQVRLK